MVLFGMQSIISFFNPKAIDLATEALKPYGLENFKLERLADGIQISDNLSKLSMTMTEAAAGIHQITRSHGSDFSGEGVAAKHVIEAYFDVG